MRFQFAAGELLISVSIAVDPHSQIRLPLFSARPAFTFSAAEHQQP